MQRGVDNTQSSIYNLFVPSDKKGETILYNTLHGSFFLVDEEAENAILNLPDDLLSEEIKEKLKVKGILVNENEDEKKILRVRRNMVKYGSSDTTLFTIFTTNLCNLACPYCYEKTFELPPISMKEKISDRVIRFIKNSIASRSYKQLRIYFYGGEPMLNMGEGLRILKMLDPWLKENEVTSGSLVITNGTLFKSDIVRDLVNYNVAFQITLDGPRTIHDKRRFYKNGQGTYDDIMNGLDTLRALKAPFQIRVNVDKDNSSYIPGLLDDLKSRFGPGIRIRFYLVQPCLKNCFTHNPSCLEGKEISILPELWNLAISKGFNLLVKPIMNYTNCGIITSHSFVVDPLGDVYRCWALLGPQHRIGTINEDGKMNIDYSYYELMSYDPTEMEGCKDCKLLPSCGGSCPSMAFDQHGTYHKTYCPEDKYIINERIKLELKQKAFTESVIC